MAQNLSYGAQNNSVESDSDNSGNDRISSGVNTTNKKVNIIKRANEELYMAAENGSLALVQQLL